MMHIRFLIFEGLFKLHKCARNGPGRHSGPHEQFSKKCCQSGWSLKRTGPVRLSEHVSEQSCPLDVLHA